MESLSERLRQERERQRRSIDDVSSATRIPRRVLEALEAGNYTLLPVFYMRSHLRTYATALGFPRAEIDRILNDVLPLDGSDHSLLRPQAPAPTPTARPAQPQRPAPSPTQQPSQPERPRHERPKTERASVATAMAADMAESVKERLRALRMPTFDMEEATKRTPKIAIIVATAILVIVVGAYFLFRGGSEEPTTTPAATEVTVGDASDAISDQDSLILTAEASDTAWITITADGERTHQLVTLPGTEYRWSAMKEFRLSLGNAGALTFYRNGTKLPTFGKQGEIVRQVIVRRTDYTSSSEAWKTTPSKPQVTAVEEPKKPTQEAQAQRKPSTQTVVPATTPRTVQKAPQRTVQRAPQRAPQRVPQRQAAVKKAPVQPPAQKPARKPATRVEIKEVPVKPLVPKR